eukprot:12398192-Karenia_brevis.AAC.1
MPVVQSSAAEPQRGFIAERHFTDNILILDTFSRMYSNLYKTYGNAILAFFDFSSAFPSVALNWIFAVLHALGAPPGLCNFVAALYHECTAYIKHQGQVEFLCSVRSGVLQGCPLAALLFVIAAEPFALLFKMQINDLHLGYVGLCADDVGAVLKSCNSLNILHEIFRFASELAGLQLNIKKCFIVPLSSPLSLHVVSILRQYLQSYIPAWTQFNIAATAEYLGIWLGPASGSRQWTHQITKYLQRVDLISAASAATALSVKTYNMKALPVLSYPA